MVFSKGTPQPKRLDRYDHPTSMVSHPNLRSASVSLLFAKNCVEVLGSALRQSLKLEPVADAELLVAETLTDPEEVAVTEADVGATDEDDSEG